jgi:SPOR domain
MLLRYLVIGGVMIALISTALTFLSKPASETSLIMALRNEQPPPEPSAQPARLELGDAQPAAATPDPEGSPPVDAIAREESAPPEPTEPVTDVVADRTADSEPEPKADSGFEPAAAPAPDPTADVAPEPAPKPVAVAMVWTASPPLPRPSDIEPEALAAIEPALAPSTPMSPDTDRDPPVVLAPDAAGAGMVAHAGPTVLPGVPMQARASAAPAALSAPEPEGAATGSGYRIQLAATRSKADAEQAWRHLRQRYTDVLGALDGSIVAADLGSRGVYYRLRAGPFGDRDRADSTCRALAEQHVDCFVVAAGGS